MNNNLLFICTGNYYRSRFAEIFFNDLASKMQVNWRAVSRGIAADEGGNEGPISIHTIVRLRLRGIPLDEPIRFPLQLEEKDLLEAGHIIALDRREHQPLMDKRFPSWADRVTYWDIPDLDISGPEYALTGIERNVYFLIEGVKPSQ